MAMVTIKQAVDSLEGVFVVAEPDETPMDTADRAAMDYAKEYKRLKSTSMGQTLYSLVSAQWLALEALYEYERIRKKNVIPDPTSIDRFLVRIPPKNSSDLNESLEFVEGVTLSDLLTKVEDPSLPLRGGYLKSLFSNRIFRVVQDFGTVVVSPTIIFSRSATNPFADSNDAPNESDQFFVFASRSTISDKDKVSKRAAAFIEAGLLDAVIENLVLTDPDFNRIFVPQGGSNDEHYDEVTTDGLYQVTRVLKYGKV